MSSAVELGLEIIEKRYHPSSWNIYTFYCGDGENWPDDDPKALEMLERLNELAQLVCYTEVVTAGDHRRREFLFGSDPSTYGLWDRLEQLAGDSLKRSRISTKDEIWPLFKRLFGGDTK